MDLLFRASRDGMNSNSFHRKCENQGQTIILIKNDKGNIFGGYSSISWLSDKNNAWHSSPESFLFTLTNIYNTEPMKFVSKNDNCEIKHYAEYRPAFGKGCDLGIYQDFLKKGGWTNFSSTYQDSLGKGKSIFTGDFNNNNNQYFKVKEVEVFKLLK